MDVHFRSYIQILLYIINFKLYILYNQSYIFFICYTPYFFFYIFHFITYILYIIFDKLCIIYYTVFSVYIYIYILVFTGLFHASLDLQSKPLQLHTQGQTVGRLDKNGAEKRDREKTRVKGMFQMG